MARSKQLKRLEPWHHQLIDWMLAHPDASGRECAAHFGKSPVWISIVKHSEIFGAEFKRRREMVSKAVTADIAGQATALAEMSLDLMSERIERDRDHIPLRQVRDVAAMALKFLGYGGRRERSGPPAQVNVDLSAIDADVLAAAREKMRPRCLRLGLIEAGR